MMMLARTASKRQYLADYKPFASVASPKNIANQIGMAVLISSSQPLLKYNQYLDRSMKADANDEEIEDFDFDTTYKTFLNDLYSSLKRRLTSNFLHKLFEYVATLKCSLRISDRLVKDVAKSMARKSQKYSRYEASQRIFSTHMWAMSLLYFSGFVYEVTLDTLHYISYRMNTAPKHAAMVLKGFPYSEIPGSTVVKIHSLSKLLSQIWKRCILFSAKLASASLGYACGSYIHPTQGGSVLSVLFEGAAENVVVHILQKL